MSKWGAEIDMIASSCRYCRHELRYKCGVNVLDSLIACDDEAFLKATGIPLSSVIEEIQMGRNARATLDAEHYCTTCGACGESGCCPARMCVRVRCMYGESYVAEIKEDLERESADPSDAENAWLDGQV